MVSVLHSGMSPWGLAKRKSLFPFDNRIAYSPISSGVAINSNVLQLLRRARAIVLQRADHVNEASADGLATFGIGRQFIENCVYRGLGQCRPSRFDEVRDAGRNQYSIMLPFVAYVAVTLMPGRAMKTSESGSPYFRLRFSLDCAKSAPDETRNPAMLRMTTPQGRRFACSA
jgi:hypothetical protein